mmetsp:Transcript_48261/g.114840  ORF Transcript_48261/g.114840 Transcript_48261/m.114840 type:complete len:249 (+) Transcript_48261:382-1128(+)
MVFLCVRAFMPCKVRPSPRMRVFSNARRSGQFALFVGCLSFGRRATPPPAFWESSCPNAKYSFRTYGRHVVMFVVWRLRVATVLIVRFASRFRELMFPMMAIFMSVAFLAVSSSSIFSSCSRTLSHFSYASCRSVRSCNSWYASQSTSFSSWSWILERMRLPESTFPVPETRLRFSSSIDSTVSWSYLNSSFQRLPSCSSSSLSLSRSGSSSLFLDMSRHHWSTSRASNRLLEMRERGYCFREPAWFT